MPHLDKELCDPQLARGMARIRHNVQSDLGPYLLQCPCAHRLFWSDGYHNELDGENGDRESLVRTGHTTSYRPCTTMVGIWRLRIAQSHSMHARTMQSGGPSHLVDLLYI